MKRTILIFSVILVFFLSGCIKIVPFEANNRRCNVDSDCVIVSALEIDNNCCNGCGAEVINNDAQKVRKEWRSQNCKGLVEDNCLMHDCYLEKIPEPVCKNNTCEINWVERN